MRNPVVFSLLWRPNQPVCVDLALRHGFDIATPPGALADEHIKAVQSAGRRYISLDPEFLGIDPSAIQTEAKARFDRFKEILPRHMSRIAQGQLGDRITRAMLGAVGKQIGVVMYGVEMLDALRRRETVAGVLLNENDLPPAKTAAMWAKHNGIPSFVVSHGAGIGEAYTITSEVIADYLLFVGERATEPFADTGFPRERMIVCGNPAWDGTPGVLAKRDRLREQIRSSMALQPGEKVVVFGTTWNAKLTALRDVNVYQDTMNAFFRACCILRDSGVKFRAVIKDRPSTAEYGKAESERLARAAGFEQYSYATGDMMGMLLGADLFVGYDTSAFVEAMIAGVPSIDIWAPSSWLVGPALNRNDGIPMIDQSQPSELAQAMQRLLTGEQARRETLEAAAARLRHFSLPIDGQAARRSADAIAQRLPRAHVQRAAAQTEVMALADLLESTPRVILDVAQSPSATAQALKQRYPSASLIALTPQAFSTEAPSIAGPADVVVLEDVLERMYDPWRFLQLLHPLLAENARVLASIPNARNFAFLSSMVQGRWEYSTSGQRDFGQLRFFTRKTISELFEQTGYHVSAVHPVYDTSLNVPEIPEGAALDMDAGAFALKGVTREVMSELRTLMFFVAASPKVAAPEGR